MEPQTLQNCDATSCCLILKFFYHHNLQFQKMEFQLSFEVIVLDSRKSKEIDLYSNSRKKEFTFAFITFVCSTPKSWNWA